MNRKNYRNFVAYIKKNKCNNDLKRYVFSKLFYLEDLSYRRFIKGFENDRALLNRFMTFLCPCKKEELLDYQIVLSEKINEMYLLKLASFFLKKRKNKLNEFIELKKKYENHIYREQYEDAMRILDLIDEKVCVSLWSCSQRFILEEQINGLESNKQLLDEYLNISNNKPVINAILDFMSTLAEKNTSYYNFQDKIKKLLSVIENQNMLYDYFSYKFNLEYDFSYANIVNVMQIEFQFSIIDLYESYVYFMTLDSINENRYCETIKEIAVDLNDNRLLNVIVLIDYRKGITLEYNNNDYYTICDCYTKGNYEETISRIVDYHNTNNINFQLVIMYIKSHIYLNKDLQSSSTLINSIYNVYSLNEQYNESVSILNSFLKQYAFVDWGIKIRAFIKRKTIYDIDERILLISYLYDEIISPNFSKYLPNTENQRLFIEDMKKVCPVSASLFESYVFGNVIKDENIDQRRRVIYNILINNKHKLAEATGFLEKQVGNMFGENAYYSEKLIRLLFVNYLASKDIPKCVSLCVKGCIENPNYIKRLPILEAMRILECSESKEFYSMIEYPIFVFLAKQHTGNEIRYAYENFLEENNVDNVLDLLKTDVYPERYLFYFLSNICTIDVLKKDVNIYMQGKNYIDVRIQILSYLIENDRGQKKKHENEFSELMKKIEIDNRAEQINKSRIHVDVEKIYSEIKHWLSESYDMYINVKNFDSTVDGININSDSFIEEMSRVASELNERMKKEPLLSQEYIIVNNMIARITEEFLFNSNFGLESFLSSRIRHGYLKDQLITVFNKHDLISKSVNDNSGTYMINDYLSSNISNSDELDQFLSFFSDFTDKIEKKIYEINTNWIRIKYRKGDVGLFDFSYFTQNTQLISLDNITDYRMFYNTVIDLLWSYVRNSLEVIKQRIDEDLKLYFDNALFILEKNIEKYEVNYSQIVSEIKQKINLCKSKLPDTINQFKDVFQVQSNKCKDFTLKDLVSTCKQINKRLFAKFDDICFCEKISFDDMLDGACFPYLVDIICILINNAINHSDFDIEKLKIEIIMSKLSEEEKLQIKNSCKERNSDIEKLEDELLSISVKNNLNKPNVEEKLKEVQSIFDNLFNPEVIKMYAQKEGGSGLYKIYQRLKYNMHSPYIVTYNIDKESFELNIIVGLSKILSKKEKL